MGIVKHVNHRWIYSGDISLEHGGFYFKEDGQDDYVLAVRITPCSDGGGPDNLFEIEDGSIYISLDSMSRVDSALNCCGIKRVNKGVKTLDDNGRIIKGKEARHALVYSCMAYQGIEVDESRVVRIGPISPFWDGNPNGWNPEPDKILRANADLRNYVRHEFLK